MTKRKSPAAVALGKARWKHRTAAEKRAHAVMMRAARTAKEALKARKISA